jgi:integrase
MTKVNLRTFPISGGRLSLYLDFYPAIPHPETGKKTRREFLGLFLFSDIEYREERYLTEKGNPKIRFIPVLDKSGKNKRTRLGELEKEHNRETKALAENIKAKRHIAIQEGKFGFLSSTKKNADFVEYFTQLTEKREGANNGNWLSALNYIKDFTGGELRFSEISEPLCMEFREYLLTAPSKRSSKQTLSQNSAHSYFNKFKAALKQAFKEGYLDKDLNGRIEPIKQAETERQYLTLEELQAVANTKCSIPILKKAALFSALTGLRFSDIQKLTWAEVRKDGNNYSLNFMQKKTKGYEVLPISEQAFKLLGERREPTERVFDGLEYSAYNNDKLRLWVLKAGITKDITFHCFRHTYATLQITLGTDLYTVSKMLGHREIKTTQVYAKIVDEKKQEAANKIKLDL